MAGAKPTRRSMRRPPPAPLPPVDVPCRGVDVYRVPDEERERILRETQRCRGWGASLVDPQRNIWTGSHADALDLEELDKHNIRGIVNCTVECALDESIMPVRFGCFGARDAPEGVIPQARSVLQLGFCDHSDAPIHRAFFAVAEYVARVGGNVLIHCQRGISRAATVTTATLMLHRGLSFRGAFERVIAARSFVAPNIGFTLMLEAFESQVAEFDRFCQEFGEADSPAERLRKFRLEVIERPPSPRSIACDAPLP